MIWRATVNFLLDILCWWRGWFRLVLQPICFPISRAHLQSSGDWRSQKYLPCKLASYSILLHRCERNYCQNHDWTITYFTFANYKYCTWIQQHWSEIVMVSECVRGMVTTVLLISSKKLQNTRMYGMTIRQESTKRASVCPVKHPECFVKT